jgi:hypothetical protein
MLNYLVKIKILPYSRLNMNAIPALVSGASQLYDIYKNYKGDTKTLGVSRKELRQMGHYNKAGKRLAIYHG